MHTSPTCGVCGGEVDPRALVFLIECHFCSRWFHGLCVQINEQEALLVTKFACLDCQQHGHQGVKYEPNNGSLNAMSVHLGNGGTSSTSIRRQYKKNSSCFRQVLGAAVYARSGVHLVSSQDVQPFFLQWNALKEPVLIADNSHQVAGLDEPFPVFDAASIAELLTMDRVVRSTDVATQTRRLLTLLTWQSRASDNQQDHEEDATLLANAEFQLQQTSMQLQVAPPTAVSQVDWRCFVQSNGDKKTSKNAAGTNVFGAFLKSNAYLDFTLAPGGQCTWLSVSAGELWVYLIPPTAANWNIYRDWKNDAKFATTFLAERVDKCIKCVVSAGSTLLVPAGWIFARFAGGMQSCSLFYGYFACTSAMETQLGVVLLETQHHALAQYWSETILGCLSVDANVQLWTAVCYYLRQLLMVNNDINVQVSDQDWRALQRALPRLHEWSALPASLNSVNDTAWTPSSQQEAQTIVRRMEQALVAMNLSIHKADELQPITALGSDSKLPPISPNEATYIYSAASVPDSVSRSVLDSTGSDRSNTSIFSSSAVIGSMWGNNSDPNLQQRSPSQNLSGYDSANYKYLSPGAALEDSEGNMVRSGSRPDGILESLSSAGGVPSQSLGTANTLLAPAVPETGFQQPQLDNNGNCFDKLTRHRASCHRCGNLRKNNVRCPLCPHIFCARCAEKMLEEHGDCIFDSGCPVCKELCCCGKNRTLRCSRKFHCYKKCPSTKRPAAG